MQLRGVLTILCTTLSVAYGLKCYTCDPINTDCTKTMTCPTLLDSCMSLNVNGLITKTCTTGSLCVSPMKCCQTDLCNGAIPTGASVVLLLVSSAIITLFL
ncbi:hypothetical protein Q5P01_015035 [Channa striata]|uniref:Uncharacterized protein n=1 Tax=Channa striata TaxID=64152 RepID=A0AA88MJT4_CHASR|nr:hypothetical protein Q5P01_015035 [Channa striata]